MGKSLRQTIIEITYHHLKKEKGQVFGQNLVVVRLKKDSENQKCQISEKV